MKKKSFATIGMIVGVLVIISGILVLTGVLGLSTQYPSMQTTYDYGYTQFGADFYTFVSNNAYQAAASSYTAAYNVHALATLLKIVFSIFFMGFGMFMFCYFGIKRADNTIEEVFARTNIISDHIPTETVLDTKTTATEIDEEEKPE